MIYNLETEPYQTGFFSDISFDITFHPMSITVAADLLVMVMLLVMSALISGSEVAFFSLSPAKIDRLKQSNSKTHKLILDLLDYPEKLLATILIANNLVNVGIVILSTFVTESLLDFSRASKGVELGFQIGVVTFLLLIFGEILPKVYATHFSLKFSNFMALPLFVLTRLFNFISRPLVNSSAIFKKKFIKDRQRLSIDDLSDALDLTGNQINEDKEILEGIVKFGNIEAKEIMKPRVDVVAVDIKYKFSKLISIIIDSEYSRIPVFYKTFDNIKGILYVKDLLRHINEDNNFAWQTLLRKPYIIPETKKINDLLSEFQQNKIHMAIVVDEYGGTSGIVTLEDVIEEILGEISDEYDTEDELSYTKLDEKTYLFEGKTLINDFCKIVGIEDAFFEEERGDADTLAGFILEQTGEIPTKGKAVLYNNITFKVEAVDKRRIKQIKVIFN